MLASKEFYCFHKNVPVYTEVFEKMISDNKEPPCSWKDYNNFLFLRLHIYIYFFKLCAYLY